MIGVSVGDIIKILDQIPIWKTVSALPKRIKELEDRVAALEAKPAAKPAEACPLCGEPMKITAVTPDPQFAFAGLQRRTFTCVSCGHAESRQFDPKKA